MAQTKSTEEAEEKADALVREMNREISAWARLSHPHVLPFLGTCDVSYIRPGHFLGLVSPFYANGNLSKYVVGRSNNLSVLLLAEVASAIHYLHTLDPPVIHGDIKGANILVNDRGQACLADFGISRVLDTQGFTTKNVLSTRRWLAVELLREEIFSTVDVLSTWTTKKSDIWAFGMTILEILTGQLPFYEIKSDLAVSIRVVDKAAWPKRPASMLVDDNMWTLLQACWSQEPECRPDSAAVALILDLLVGSTKERFSIDNSFIRFLLETTSSNSSSSEIVDRIYPCNVSGCEKSFDTLGECIEHELAQCRRLDV